MEFWLSRSLSWTSLSHDGILATTKPFMIFCFTQWNSGYHEAFHEFFFHTMEFWLSQSLPRIFHMVELTWHMIWGRTLFICITKSIYIGSASLKTLPLDLEPPLQQKEYGPPCSKENAKKVNVFVPETTYRLVVRVFWIFTECKLTKRNDEQK
jgi:hypothetical protein